MYNKHSNANVSPTLQRLMQSKRICNYQSDISALGNVNIYISALQKVLTNCEQAANFEQPQNEYGIYAVEYLKLLENARAIMREFVEGFLRIAHQMQEKEDVEMLLRVLNGMQQLLELFVMSKEQEHLQQLQNTGQTLLCYFRNCQEELAKNSPLANQEYAQVMLDGCNMTT